ncbi:hypothetical protein F5884DRAFT_905307 [Xylogone sp. PMI_703]|nr:hypothetical protein F5884DRAFT_905307 [Xylogone sp. PMI_703]
MASNVPIAIIGMSCRFPGDVSNPEELWQLLADGRSGWSEIPSSRFNLDGVYHPNASKINTSNVKGGHFLSQDLAAFDAAFFNLPSETASILDPQFRLQLESTYEALESAGIPLHKVAGSNTSVFAGAFFRDYSDAHLKDPETMSRFLLVGVGSAMAANRISHFYDLRGASMTIDTGCSTTLTALHQACQNLQAGESDMSIVGGANIILNPDNFIIMSSLALLGPDGKSYTFDSRANGYGRGEGSATVILKRLDDALRDGDPVRAVIRASAVNQDGKTETITSPSREAQEELIRACYRKAGLSLSETTYFEAHGTGTPTGDPIEAGAVAAVFKDSRPPGEPLRIGSIKTNIGHTETPSGLASIIKVALATEKGQIPPSINYEKPNPKLKLDEWNLKVPTQLEDWNSSTGVRRASVNNFGYGGANAHVIVEGYESFMSGQKRITNGTTNGVNGTAKKVNGTTNGVNGVNGTHKPSQSRVITLSAKDEQATQAMISNLKDYLLKTKIENEDELLSNLAYTLGERRSVFPWVAAQSVNSVSDLVKTIESGKMKPARSGEAPRLGFVFTGQGAQWFAMGRELIDAYPVFKATLLEAESYLKKLGANWSLLEELQRDEQTSRVNEVALSTAMCVAVQVALVRLLRSWGVVPVGVTSHSSGEVASACAAGAISLERAMAIVYFRGELAGDMGLYITGKGGMVAVGLGTEGVAPYLSRVTAGKVGVACINSPNSVTVSGDVPGVEQLETMLLEDQVFARRLRINAAYHSHHMEAIGKPYLSFLNQFELPEDGQLEGVVYSSPTTGERMDSIRKISDPNHWVRSLTQPVRFVDAFRSMCFDGTNPEPIVDVVIEIGPHAALSGPIQEIVSMLPDFAGTEGRPSYMTALIRKNSALATMHTLACNLIRSGYPVDLKAVNFPHAGSRDHIKVLHDLPVYPWNHQVRHWSESKANLSQRQRSQPPHDLLGSLSLNTNMLAPTWRHIIRVDDMPWVRDHVVQSNIVYPGAGYLTMAIEGALQLFHINASAQDAQGGDQKKKQHVLGYQLRDVDILQALIIPETRDGVEVQLSLRPCSDKTLYGAGWQEFQVSSVTVSSDNVTKWSEHCKGLILVQTTDEEVVNGQSPPAASAGSHSPTFAKATVADYRLRVEPRDIYAMMRSGAICHGPIFQNLKTIRAREKESVSNFVVADTAVVMPNQYQQKHVIHPTTLDSIFQAAYTALPGAGSKAASPQIPRSINRLWISHSISSEPGHRFNAYSTMQRADLQSFDAGITVVDAGNDDEAPASDPVLSMSGFICQSIGNTQQDADSRDNEKFGLVKWQPDLTFATPSFLKQHLSYPVDPNEASVVTDLKRLCIYYIADALAGITTQDVQQLEKHHKKYYVWMKHQLELASTDKLAPGSSSWIYDGPEERAALIAKAGTSSVNGEMVCRLGPSLLAMMRHEAAPLELMMEGRLLYRYYEEALKYDRSSQQIGKLVEHFVHKNPRAKILEIGGGTGGTSTHILGAIGTDDSPLGPQASSYDFTDISSGFFEAAQEKLKAWKSLVRYKKLDIEQDVAKQGFEEGTYDLIVACQVLHATKSMENTMTNVRKLLKPGGKLLLLETTQDHIDLHYVFGLVPGWWLSEEQERETSPNLTIDMWQRVLSKTGFSGIDAEVHDCESEVLYSFSVMTSTAISKAPTFNSEVVIVTESPAPPASWMMALKASIAKLTGSVPTTEALGSVKGDDDKLYIFLGELARPILSSPSLAEFEAIKALCTKAKGILWVTRGGAVDCEDVHSGLSTGFLRTLRREYGEKRLVALDIDPKQELWSTESVIPVTEIFKRMFDYSIEDPIKDFEYAYRDGIMLIPRYYKDVERNKEITADSADLAVPEPGPFHKPGRPLRMFIGTPGLMDTLAFSDDPDAVLSLEEGTIEVEPKAFAVNFRDVLVAMGHLNTRIMGFECAGFVTRVSQSAAAAGYKPGDRVAMFLRGHYGSLVRAPWTSAVHIPDDVTFEVAASLPMSFATAHHAVYDQAHLQKGETILIHAGSGAFGQAAIMLAKHIGAEIFVTVGTQAKRDLMTDVYGIKPDHIFNSRDASFAAGVLAMTDGKGVDVVLNSLAGNLLQESFNCIARFGRFIEIGKRDLELNNHLELGSFVRVASFSSIDLLEAIKYKPHKMYETLKEVMRLFHERLIKPVTPLSVYPVSDIGKAFRFMQAGKHMGKLIITTSPDDLVPVLPEIPSAKLRPDASYLIVGGLGGIGRSVCHWMSTRGAKNIIVLSRSANAQQKAATFLAEMAKVGCRVKTVGCDVANEAALAEVLRTCAQDMPPIRGVVQAAMVLQDSILELMKLEDWSAAVRPKVQGSWNLHQQLSKTDLDFFVILSSLAGICGYASQANYSAGGSFEDALAKYRTKNGQPGVAIDIGIVKSVGYVAETEGTAERLIGNSGYMLLSEDDVLKAVESAILTPYSGQILLGLNEGSNRPWEETQIARDLRFSSLRYQDLAQNSGNTNKAGSSDLLSKIAAATSFDEAAQVVMEGITKKLMDIFMIEESEVNPAKSLSSYGVDSLVAVELRNMLSLRAGADISIFDIMQSSSITSLAATVAAKSSHIDPSLIP